MNAYTAITKQGRLTFNFDAMQWQNIAPEGMTKAHRFDGTVMARIAAEVNADVHCVKVDAFQVVSY